MTTPEQQAREMLAALELPFMAEAFSASRLAPLANLIAENTALKAELAAIKGAGEPVGHVYTMEPCIPGEHVRYHAQMTAKVPAGTKLYTRPCVPLTDEQIVSIRDEHLPSQGDSFDCVAFARAVEAHIKGAKG